MYIYISNISVEYLILCAFVRTILYIRKNVVKHNYFMPFGMVLNDDDCNYNVKLTNVSLRYTQTSVTTYNIKAAVNFHSIF